MREYMIQESTLTAIADVIRSKNGSTDPVSVADMAAQIQAITGGGGSFDDVRYVTFMNGDTVLYVKPVAVGDDCVDVHSKGLIGTPTKESTADQTFTFYGWGAVDGGAADNSILQAITEDKTVYAIFTAAVRYYTVSFYDGDTLIATRKVAYGGASDYTHAKDNHIFMGWTPQPVNITSDMACYGSWEESYTFADASWEYINSIAARGLAAEAFALGDTKDVILTYEDGTSETVTMQIADFDRGVLADGSGNAKMVLVAKTLLKTSYTSQPWETVCKWENTEFYTAYLNGTVFNAMPEGLRNVIKEVNSYSFFGTVLSSKVSVPNHNDLNVADSNLVDSLMHNDPKGYSALALYDPYNAALLKKYPYGVTSGTYNYWISTGYKYNNYYRMCICAYASDDLGEKQYVATSGSSGYVCLRFHI